MVSRSSTSPSGTSSLDSTVSLDERARIILDLLCNEHDIYTATSYIHPSVTVQHDDDPPHTSRAAFLSTFAAVAAKTPSFHMLIREAVVDERQRKVWVRSEIRGLPNGVVKESIDQMTFDDDGLLIRSEDTQRVRKGV